MRSFTRMHLAIAAAAATIGLFTSPCVAQVHQSRGDAAPRIVSIGGGITEILYAIGAGDRIVAVDATSQHPPEALRDHKSVGYYRALSTEGVLSVSPGLIIASDKAGPPEVVRALKASGLPYVEIDDKATPEALVARIGRIAEIAGKPAEGRQLADRVTAGFARLSDVRARMTTKPPVLVVLAVTSGRATVAGRETSSDLMLQLAGATNAANTLSGFKPVSGESILTMQPETIIVMKRGPTDTTVKALRDMTGVSETPAGRNKRIFEMDALYLLGFGPRAADAARDLMQHVHGTKSSGGKG